MIQQEIFETIVKNLRDILPGMENREITQEDSLRKLGANSIDRSEIIMMTLEAMKLKVSLIEFAKAENIGELASIMYAKQ